VEAGAATAAVAWTGVGVAIGVGGAIGHGASLVPVVDGGNVGDFWGGVLYFCTNFVQVALVQIQNEQKLSPLTSGY
jgi:hypothetical protein